MYDPMTSYTLIYMLEFHENYKVFPRFGAVARPFDVSRLFRDEADDMPLFLTESRIFSRFLNVFAVTFFFSTRSKSGCSIRSFSVIFA